MELMELLKTRRTYRRFDQTRAISEEIVQEMKEALRIASSAANLQPLRYIFVRDPEKVEEIFPLTHWAASLPKELGTPKEGEHPVMYLAVLYDESKKNKWLDTDIGLALSNVTLAAWGHGVGSCIMGSIDRPEIKRALNVPEQLEIQSVVAFGYPTHQSIIVDPGEDGSLKYYLDEDRNYMVPKRPIETFIEDI